MAMDRVATEATVFSPAPFVGCQKTLQKAVQADFPVIIAATELRKLPGLSVAQGGAFI
jgi:hypothetical protein